MSESDRTLFEEVGEEIGVDELRVIVIRAFGISLNIWRNWLLKICSKTEGAGSLMVKLKDGDLTPTFGSIVRALTDAAVFDLVVEFLLTNEDVLSQIITSRGLPKDFGWRWCLTTELNPDYAFLVRLRRRFKGVRFSDFRACLIERLLDGEQELALAVSLTNDFCELVWLMRECGRLKQFKNWLTSYQNLGRRPSRSEVWTASLRLYAQELSMPEWRDRLYQLAEHYATDLADFEALFLDRKKLLRRLCRLEQTGDCDFADPAEPDYRLLWWQAFADNLPPSFSRQLRRRVRALSSLRRLADATRDFRKNLFWANSTAEPHGEN